MSMIRQVKKEHAEKIAAKMERSGGPLYKAYLKDLQKLNYATLVALSSRVK